METQMVPRPRKRYILSTEPIMFLFMSAACLKFPVFKPLLFRKACYNNFGFVSSYTYSYII